MKTVIGFDAKGNPQFSNVGMSLRNAAGDFDTTTLGYQRALTTLTYQKKKVTTQKFYKIPIASYVPVAIGDGAFSASMLTHMQVSSSGDFEEGIIHQGQGNARIARATIGKTSKTVAVANWAKSVDYTLIEVEQAMVANNWNMIEGIYEARKMNWDLGIQQLAFLGLRSDQTNFPGLLTQSGCTINTSLITASLATLSSDNFNTFIGSVVETYRLNCNRTAYPTHFFIPEDDYNGLVSQMSSTYPVRTKMSILREAFSDLGLGGITILPLAYAMPTYNKNFINVGTGKHRYILMNYDDASIRMDIPVNFTPTAPGTWNNFNFQNVAYGQFTGVGLYRNLELMYFDY